MDYYEIGQRIRKIRKSRNISQERLAEQVGISVTHMSHIETGNTKLSLQVLVDLANALEVGTDDLLYPQVSKDRNISMEEIAQLLSGCTTVQLKVIEDVIKAMKIAFDKYT